jgi:hypothetical protein
MSNEQNYFRTVMRIQGKLVLVAATVIFGSHVMLGEEPSSLPVRRSADALRIAGDFHDAIILRLGSQNLESRDRDTLTEIIQSKDGMQAVFGAYSLLSKEIASDISRAESNAGTKMRVRHITVEHRLRGPDSEGVFSFLTAAYQMYAFETIDMDALRRTLREHGVSTDELSRLRPPQDQEKTKSSLSVLAVLQPVSSKSAPHEAICRLWITYERIERGENKLTDTIADVESHAHSFKCSSGQWRSTAE